ncbi:hypothetical protein D210916BOD24_18280 [Alteromonas sp. D210916BOD_24]|uniref:mechanosensitive ion channel family protein n=1 Tax=Alteromonas sp. D210916BOD_24 TaxID=3157618 RepID=UPI00399CD85C
MQIVLDQILKLAFQGLNQIQVAIDDPNSGATSLSNAQSLLTELWENFIYRLPGLGLGIAVMVVFIFIASPLSRFLVKPLTRTTTSPLLRSVIQRSISLALVLLGIYLFLFLAGLTGFAIAVVSGTGVIGLILGFAFRDIAENFISSLLLTIQRPFRIGDIVQINEFTGIIQKVTARATTMVDFDGNHIQIPNAIIYKGVIKNLTANPLMRGNFVIGVGYDSSIQQAQQIAQSVIALQENVLKDPEPQVLIDKLGASSYNVKVYFWVDVEKTSVLKMASLLMRNIVEAFTRAGISMPDDARERVFPQGLHIAMSDELKENSESAVPPASKTVKTESVKKALEPQQGAAETTVNKILPSEEEDVATEAHDIREQARRARDPEAGKNIL